MIEQARDNITFAKRAGAVCLSAMPLLLGLAFAFILHWFIAPELGPFYSKVLIDVGIAIILAVSLNIINGMTGQFSIGHAGFMAAGGYTAAAIMYYGSYHAFGEVGFFGGAVSWTRKPADFDGAFFAWGDLLFLGACLAGGSVAALLGLIVGLPSLRLRGDYLAIVTLGFGEIVRVLIEQSKPVIDADMIDTVPAAQHILHLGGALGFSRQPPFYYTTLFWVAAFVVLMLMVAYRLRQSTYGRAFLSIRENEIAAEAMGVPTTQYKVSAFVISAFFAGVAGALFAHQVGAGLNPSELGFMKSIDILIMVVLGGLGSISGAIVAATLLTILPEWLREPTHVWKLAIGAAVIIVLARQQKATRPLLFLAGITGAIELARWLAIQYDVNLADYRMILYAGALVLMMILRPQGLFGIHEVWEFFRWPFKRRRPVAADSKEAGR